MLVMWVTICFIWVSLDYTWLLLVSFGLFVVAALNVLAGAGVLLYVCGLAIVVVRNLSYGKITGINSKVKERTDILCERNS
jgi:hypothetical protein